MDSSEASGEAIPLTESEKCNLSAAEAYEYLTKAGNVYKESTCLDANPPVQPRGGSIFLYDLGPDRLKWEANKRKIRCDQYRWVHKGTYPIKHDSGIVMKKKSSTIDVPNDNSGKGDDRFRRFEYWGIGPYFLVHYVGDCTVFEGFCHRNSKDTIKPFIRSAPHVKEKVLGKDTTKSPRVVYQELVNESCGGPQHAVYSPRDQTQVRNFRKGVNKQNRLSHDAIFNTYHLCYQLKMKNRKGDPQDFISHLSIYPNVIVRMSAQPLMESLESLMRLSSSSVTLHYDTVFNMGDFYLSTLLFRHSVFKGQPVVPFAFLVHTRRFIDDHVRFMEAIRQSFPCLASKKMVIVTDREFDFSSVFPLAQHVYCWNHLERDLHFYLKQKANCTGHEISYFANVFKELMQEPTEVELNRCWSNYKDKDAFQSNETVCNYFETKLLPTFKHNSSVWVLKSAGISHPENGITNNCSESMNAVLHRLQNWKQVPLDVVCYSLFQLSCFYQREIERAFHQCGSWEVHDEFSFLCRDPSMMPYLPKVIDPKEIVARAKGDIISQLNEREDDGDGDSNSNNGDSTMNRTSSTNTPTTQLGLAYEAIQNKRVSLVNSGCWMVVGTDGSTPYAVRLFPKETCTCPAAGLCYHLIACKLMIGQKVDDIVSKPNMTAMQQRSRRKDKERPSGRKQPRIKDFARTREKKEEGISEEDDTVMPVKRKRPDNSSKTFKDRDKQCNSFEDEDDTHKRKRCDDEEVEKPKKCELGSASQCELDSAGLDDKAPTLEEFDIEMTKSSGPLGLVVMGGADTTLNDVVIKEIVPNTPADIDGKLRPGDQILKVNGEDMKYSTHRQVVQAMQNCGPCIKLNIRRRLPATKDENIALSETTPDQPIKASTASNRLTRLLLKGRLQNVKTERNFAGYSLSWNSLLERINVAFPDVLFFPYVCQTGLAEEITNLPIGKLLVLQTKRSNQVAVLKRLNDKEGSIPRVEVISTYALPDHSELNYHAGTATRSMCLCLETLHLGVQCCKDDGTAEVVAGILLLYVCKYPSEGLGKVRVGLDNSPLQLYNVLDEHFELLDTVVTTSTSDFCKTQVDHVQLYCYCLTPWIEGTTSYAIYGDKQKDYNVYNCSGCDNWYHKCCLAACHIPIPKRKADFLCKNCEIPATVQWNHESFTNTCTSDNFLTVLLLHCKQYDEFLLSVLGCSTVEDTLKAAITLMLKGKVYEGKTVFLRMLSSAVNLPYDHQRYDCYGGENDKCLCLFTHIWKIVVKQKCTSLHCPANNAEITKFLSSFAMASCTEDPFPQPGTQVGYCGAEFHSEPPKESLHGLTNRLQLDTNQRMSFYECRGKLLITSAAFVNSNPWLLPIDIQSLSPKEILNLKPFLTVYGFSYQLAGCSLNSGNHFTAVIFWYGKIFYYDGMQSKGCRLIPFMEDQLNNKTGSYAYYFITHSS